MQLTLKQLQFDRQLDLTQIREFRKTGKIELLAEVYMKYAHLVYGLAIKYLGDRTLAQKAIVDLFEKLTIESVKNEIPNLREWIGTSAKYYCINYKEPTGVPHEKDAGKKKNHLKAKKGK